MLSCGEPSGDLYAGALTKELRQLESGVDVFGLGGGHLAVAEVLIDRVFQEYHTPVSFFQ